jgi:hypothetical protein
MLQDIQNKRINSIQFIAFDKQATYTVCLLLWVWVNFFIPGGGLISKTAKPKISKEKE